MSIGTWTVAEAKAKFSKVIDQARLSGPQIITRIGRVGYVRRTGAARIAQGPATMHKSTACEKPTQVT